MHMHDIKRVCDEYTLSSPNSQRENDAKIIQLLHTAVRILPVPPTRTRAHALLESSNEQDMMQLSAGTSVKPVLHKHNTQTWS